MTATLTSTARAQEAFLKDKEEELRAYVVNFEANAVKAVSTKVFLVEALGVEMTLPQVAITYQAYKGVPNSLGENARAFAKSISSECLAIIKQNGVNADWKGIALLASYA